MHEHWSPRTFWKCIKYGLPKPFFTPTAIDSGESIFWYFKYNNFAKIGQYSKPLLGMFIRTWISRLMKNRSKKSLWAVPWSSTDKCYLFSLSWLSYPVCTYCPCWPVRSTLPSWHFRLNKLFDLIWIDFDISRLTTVTSPYQYDLCRLICPRSPILSVLPRLSCPNCPVPIVLSQLPFTDVPVPTVLSQLSCPNCLLPTSLSQLSFQSVLSWLTCPVCTASLYLYGLICSGYYVQTVPSVLSWLSLPTLFSWPSWPVLAVLSKYFCSCPGCPDPETILFPASYPNCPAFVVMVDHRILTVPSQLPCPGFPFPFLIILSGLSYTGRLLLLSCPSLSIEETIFSPTFSSFVGLFSRLWKNENVLFFKNSVIAITLCYVNV